ncbi:MAG: PAS domain S-box protein [Candidatus Cloacimonetes bacterium]|nr:PAS domain S-box protein [Candidatus Cloacimonadota bacterium]
MFRIYALDNDAQAIVLFEQALKNNFPFDHITGSLLSKETIPALRKHIPDLIIINLNNLSDAGAEFYLHLQEDKELSEIPLILIYDPARQSEFNDLLSQPGVAGLLPTPYENVQLVVLIRSLLKLRKARLDLSIEKTNLEMLVRKRSLELQASEIKLDNFLDSSTIGIWCFRPECPIPLELETEEMIQEFFQSVCVECNAAYARMNAASREQIIGLKLNKIMPDTPDNRDYFRAFIANGFHLSDGISHEINQAGEDKYFSNSFHATIEDNCLIEAWGTQTDITASTKAEKELTEKTRQLETLISNLPGLVFRCRNDSNWTMEFMSDTCLKITGYQPAAFINNRDLTFNDIIHPEDRKLVRDEIQKAINQNSIYHVRYRILNKDNNIKWVYEHGQAVVSDQGKILALEGIIFDISDQILSELALKESEERFRSIVEFSQEGIMILNDRAEFEYINNMASVITGYTREDAIGRNLDKFLTPESLKTVMEYNRKRISGLPAPIRYSVQGIRKDGKIIDVEISASTFRDRSGKIKTLTQALDISDRLRAEKIQSVLYNIARATSTARNLDELYPLIRQNLSEVLDTTNFFLALYDENTDLLTLPYEVDQIDKHTSFPPGKTLSAYVIKTGKAILAKQDTIEELTSQGHIELVGSPSQVWMGAPLKIGVKTIGVIVLQSYTDPDLYNENDLNILEFVSYEIARTVDSKKAEEHIKKSLAEKETMLQEIHHRVKNNLQIISSLLSIQARDSQDPYTLDMLRESQNRVKSMAIIHHKLYEGKDLAHIDFQAYIRSLVNYLVSSYKIDTSHIGLQYDIKDAYLNLSTAIPCGLILNEIISNALKYAFPDKTGNIFIKLHNLGDGLYEMIVRDDGKGFSPDVDISESSTLGLNLINIFTQQLHGELDLRSKNGVEYRIRFHEKKKLESYNAGD